MVFLVLFVNCYFVDFIINILVKGVSTVIAFVPELRSAEIELIFQTAYEHLIDGDVVGADRCQLRGETFTAAISLSHCKRFSISFIDGTSLILFENF